jgi:hypothetical protein
MAYENVNATPNFQRQVLGQKGFRKLRTGNTSTVGEFYRAITVLADASITLTSEAGDGLTTETVAAGITIYGLFSSITVVSGDVLAYIA